MARLNRAGCAVGTGMTTHTAAAPGAQRELVLGGQKSGKSRWAEQRAAAWLLPPGRAATLIATAQARDPDMAERIARHQRDRAARCPGLVTVEGPEPLHRLIDRLSRPEHLLVIDCLTLWLTQGLMPAEGPAWASPEDQTQALLHSVARARGPLVIVSNEIGLGVIPMGRETRRFVDALGQLHQALAQACDRVTLMVAGCPVTAKAAA